MMLSLADRARSRTTATGVELSSDSVRRPLAAARRLSVSRKLERPAGTRSELGRLLRDLRIGAGLTEHALARRAAVDPATISYLEHGRRRASRELIRRLWLGVNGETDDLDRLLAAAGLLPESVVAAGGWDAYLRLWRGQVAVLEHKLELRIEHSSRQIHDLLARLEAQT